MEWTEEPKWAGAGRTPLLILHLHLGGPRGASVAAWGTQQRKVQAPWVGDSFAVHTRAAPLWAGVLPMLSCALPDGPPATCVLTPPPLDPPEPSEHGQAAGYGLGLL